MDLSSIYTELIAEHNASTRNRRRLENPDAVMEGINPSCGDELEIAVRIKDGVIEDAAYTGSGCAISQASASMMTDLMRGKTLTEAHELVETFLGMIRREITDEERLYVLGEAAALVGIAELPARVKCAVLAWHTLQGAIKEAK